MFLKPVEQGDREGAHNLVFRRNHHESEVRVHSAFDAMDAKPYLDILVAAHRYIVLVQEFVERLI